MPKKGKEVAEPEEPDQLDEETAALPWQTVTVIIKIDNGDGTCSDVPGEEWLQQIFGADSRSIAYVTKASLEPEEGLTN
eukprot:SAG31_NODE_19625_length_596_cov_1.217304_1_plen_78_part_10